MNNIVLILELCEVYISLGLKLDGSRDYYDVEAALPGKGILTVHEPPKFETFQETIVYRTWWPNSPGAVSVDVSK